MTSEAVEAEAYEGSMNEISRKVTSVTSEAMEAEAFEVILSELSRKVISVTAEVAEANHRTQDKETFILSTS